VNKEYNNAQVIGKLSNCAKNCSRVFDDIFKKKCGLLASIIEEIIHPASSTTMLK
jgi:hypothetical protein